MASSPAADIADRLVRVAYTASQSMDESFRPQVLGLFLLEMEFTEALARST